MSSSKVGDSSTKKNVNKRIKIMEDLRWRIAPKCPRKNVKNLKRKIGAQHNTTKKRKHSETHKKLQETMTPNKLASKMKEARVILTRMDMADLNSRIHELPQQAAMESVTLQDKKLLDDEENIWKRPHTNITGFSIYDKHGHLCHLDNGLVDKKVLYMSGYLKLKCSDSPDIDEESVPVRDVGPIVQWYTSGLNSRIKNCITIATEVGEYDLLNPSAEYEPLMNDLNEKVLLCRVVIEYLNKQHKFQPTYEDLLKIIRGASISHLGDKQLSEDILHKHAQFLCDQIVSVDIENDVPFITLPCIMTLINLMVIKLGKCRMHPNIVYKKENKKAMTKATTTPLVRKTFESLFKNQLDKTTQAVSIKDTCGICKPCQQSNCGKCSACRPLAIGMARDGRTNNPCACLNNKTALDADDADPESEVFYPKAEKNKIKKHKHTIPVKRSRKNKTIVWIGEGISDNNKEYYEMVQVESLELQAGDYVMVASSKPGIPALVARIIYMYKDNFEPTFGYFHGEAFIRSSDTILGEVGDPSEIFMGDRCCFVAPLSSILRKAIVEKKHVPTDWFKLGGKEVEDQTFEDDEKSYFYNKFYDRATARFEDLPSDLICPNFLRKHRFCSSCVRTFKCEFKSIPKIIEKLDTEFVKETDRSEWTLVNWKGHDYKKGSGVFLGPKAFRFTNKGKISNKKDNVQPNVENVNEDTYPEYYRKNDNVRGSNENTGQPFCVGCVAAVVAVGDGPLIAPQDIYLKVNVLYRPENTTIRFPHREDLNVVYWSDEIIEIPFMKVLGPCNLIYEENIPQKYSIQEWLDKDPNFFYFKMAYDKKSNEFIDVPNHAKNIGRIENEKSKGYGKGKGKSNQPREPDNDSSTEDTKIRPLKTLDVFAGCGGLSEGLHQAGIADCQWAIENAEPAAHAYSLNNRNCTMFLEDCNALLKDVIGEATHTRRGERLPRPGEVELLCGGPPCQGFSAMNRFNSREYSNFKNSLVSSFLSYCDYYRPKYIVLENVRNFVAFKKAMVLKLTMRTLLEMGYQCTFGILQAGNYGIPQTRRRLIVLAAAPGHKLPLYPEPTHVFNSRWCPLTARVDGRKYESNIKWTYAAPMRTCTIRDAMSDLPPIANGASKMEIKYSSKPGSHFQRMVRSLDETLKLRDHICKHVAPLVQARISRIPTKPGSDWRDLPNISVTLSDGSKCKILRYNHQDPKNGRSGTGANRGVCECVQARNRSPCTHNYKQENTLIPWCLPHTANRNNHWAGLYGRVAWEGYFGTTVTDPEPMGKQGRVLHPDQHRVVSVRECARSQGFPDTYRFAGTVQDKHRQIGNAVPPPLAAALGREIKKSLAADQYQGEDKFTFVQLENL